MAEQLQAVAVVGGGNMGSAIIAGLLRLEPPPVVTVIDPDASTRQRHAEHGCQVGADPELAAASQVVLLAVKPQMVAEVAATLAPHCHADQLLVSILAGTTSATLRTHFPAVGAIVRAMPNTPMAVGLGMVGLCAGPGADDRHLDLAEALFAPAAKVLRCDESRIDDLTAVSGSGPAYLFRFAEALHAGARDLGFNDDEAALLVGTTLAGSITYLLAQDGFPAARLREQVTSPGGTTAAALAAFDAGAGGDFGQLVSTALRAAADRARELACQ